MPPGVRKTSPIINLVAANTPLAVYTKPAGRSAIVRKIMWHNRSMATGVLRIGTTLGSPIPLLVPPVDAPANLTGQLDEPNINSAVLDAQAATAITAETTAAIGAAPNDFQVQIEVEEYPAA